MTSTSLASTGAADAGMSEERYTVLSKKLCYLLRHGLSIFEAKGCPVYGPGEGWVLLDDLLHRVAPAILRRRFTDDEIEACLRTSRSGQADRRPRFELREWKTGRPRWTDSSAYHHAAAQSNSSGRGSGSGAGGEVAEEEEDGAMDLEEQHKERPVWLVRATYAHSAPLDRIQRRLPLNWDKDEVGSSDVVPEGGTKRSCISLIRRCIDVICTNIKRYDGLGGVLDDALLRQVIARLKESVNLSRPMISALLGHQLLTLDLEDVFVSDGVLRDIAKRCPSLAHLSLRGCYSAVTDQALQQLTKSCKSITVLNIGDCKYVSDKGLQSIARNLTGLEVLNVSNNGQITDSGVQHLAALNKLKLLNVVGCTRISTGALQALHTAVSNKNQGREIHIEADQNEPIYFLGPDETPYGFMSSNSLHTITIDGLAYPSVQHYYQSKKFAGTPREEEIRSATSPEAAFKMGRQGGGYNMREDWEDVKSEIMRRGFHAKFQQSTTLRKALLSTGERMLVSRSRDPFWGQGSDKHGKNMHGRILMDIRDTLKDQHDS